VVESAVTGAQYAMAPWATGGSGLNFVERHQACASLFGSGTHDRLREVKATYDAHDVIRSNDPVQPAQR
jgi:hypothetical protein